MSTINLNVEVILPEIPEEFNIKPKERKREEGYVVNTISIDDLSYEEISLIGDLYKESLLKKWSEKKNKSH